MYHNTLNLCLIYFLRTEIQVVSIKMELETVIEFHNSEDVYRDSREKSYPTDRFCSTKLTLNTLALRTIITRMQANESNIVGEKDMINANGTWQSISKWGENEGLEISRQHSKYLPQRMSCHFMMMH
jgi:hypothetical protein